MASSLPPVKGAAFTFDVCLVSQADTDIFKTSVTLAAGDITVSKDGGAFSNITTLPTEIGTSGVLPVALSATEMNADRVTVRIHDAAGDEWQDALVTIYTAAQTLDTTDGIADAIKAKTDNLPASPAAVGSAMTLAANQDVRNVTGSVTGSVGSVTNPVTAGTVSDKTGYALTAAYDAAKTAATQTSVDDIPNTAEFNARTLPSADYTVVSDLPTVPSAADNATAAAAAILVTPANLLLTDASGQITLAANQGAVTFGQVKIVANVAGQGALDVLNQHANGIGTHNVAGLVGQRNVGGSGIGLENASSGGVGQRNAGPLGGQVNLGSSSGPGQSNEGSIGQYNNGTATVGQRNEGAETGQYNYGSAGYGVQTAGDTADYDPALGGASLDAQAVADALKLAPTAGAPAAGSVYAEIADVPSAADNATAAATAILVTPANKLGTDASGRVTPDTVTPATDVSELALEATAQSILTDTGTTGVVVADKTGYQLASDGLDVITATEPTGKPTTFAGWVMWLVQRFRRADMTAATLTVKTEAGATVTQQTVSDDGTTQSIGAPS